MEKPQYHIAVIVTSFNRKDTTLTSLRSLYVAQQRYNLTDEGSVALSVFLTDDGCTDGTAEAVKTEFPDKEIVILHGDGTLYWAGGMRKAWQAAIDTGRQWDFYLLLNDDTLCYEKAFSTLLQTHNEVKRMTGKSGVYSAVCCSSDHSTITYGGARYNNRFFGKSINILPTGKPEPCQRTNANLLLVSHEVVERIGIFDSHYRHNCADWAYGIEASKAHFPVFITPEVCAICDDDHGTIDDEHDKVKNLSIAERKAFYSHPLRSTADKMHFMWKYYKPKFFFLYAARQLAIYSPAMYYKLLKMRP